MKSDEQLLTEILPGEKDILGKVQEIRRKARNSALREAAKICHDNKHGTAGDAGKAILALIK